MRTVFLFVFLAILPASRVIAQKQKIIDRAVIPIESISDKKAKTGNGYFVVVSMTELQTPYSVLVTQKDLVKDADQVTLTLPLENGKVHQYHISKSSKHMFSTKSNDLVIIHMAAITAELKKNNIETDFVFIPEASLNEVGFSIDRSALEELKKDWELSWKI